MYVVHGVYIVHRLYVVFLGYECEMKEKTVQTKTALALYALSHVSGKATNRNAEKSAAVTGLRNHL